VKSSQVPKLRCLNSNSGYHLLDVEYSWIFNPSYFAILLVRNSERRSKCVVKTFEAVGPKSRISTHKSSAWPQPMVT
jgi:hypothetical protein